MKYKLIYLIISLSVIIPGVVSLVVFGLRPGIDFTGGTILNIRGGSATPSASLREASSSSYIKPIKDLFDSQKIAYESIKVEGQDISLRLKEMNEEKKGELISLVSKNIIPVTESRFETVGPLLGQELIFKTLVGIILAALLITLYIIYQFKDRLFGFCAILATVHDSLVILGIFSLLGHFLAVEVDILFVTAVLTVLSFSVHDTIVVYDRIREKIKNLGVKFSNLSVADLEMVVDSATNETLARSLNNSLTVIFMLTALTVLGGVTIQWFALALLIGTVSGTYSSPFVAGPLLIVFKKLLSKKARNS